MKLIHKLEIEGFRSIRKEKLPALGDFTAFAGLNNSGKSNVLRALNAFFRAETDPGQAVTFGRDYSRPDLTKKKKRIRISVTFDLPAQFKFRKGLEAARDFLGGNQFEIAKEWAPGEPAPSYYLNNEPKPELEARLRIDQFLSLIKLRYVPNRVLPIDVIRSEHQALRDVLVRRLGRKAKVQEEAFESIRHASEKLVQSLADRFSRAVPNAGAVRLATPTSWNEMVFAFGYRLTQNNVEIDDSFQGSGIQSLLMFETLYLIDRDYFQKFGWQQAVIWAVEEPESSLHTSLEAQVASYLSSISTDPDSRLQVLCTTHSDLMLQYADKTVAVEQKDGRSSLRMLPDSLSAIDRMSRAGVSRWVDPLLYYPLDPLILVEGKFDHTFLESALAFVRKRRDIRVSYLERLEPTQKTGGKDDLQKYVQNHASAIKTRRKDAPVIVLLDWDAAGKKDSFQKHFKPDDPFKVLAWPNSTFNPKLGATFHGIERSYSDRIIREGEKRGVKLFRSDDGTCAINVEEFGKVKQKLHDVVKEGLDPEDLKHLKPFLDEVLVAAGANL